MSVVFLYFQTEAYGVEIYLKNNDRISGEIIGENEENVSVNTEAMGEITVNKGFIDRIVREEIIEDKTVEAPEEETPEIIWQRELEAGYNVARGNTENDQLYASLFINRNKVRVNEVTLKGDIYYSAKEKETDAEKWYAMGRYAFSFGETKKWYNFYKFEYDHDRFADIDYRFIPSTGAGYWFFDEPDTKLMAELAAGTE